MPEISNRKWGPSTVLGTSGGVVTWSIVSGGKSGVNDTFGGATSPGSSDVSVNARDVLGYDPAPLIRTAFAAWAQHADIRFVQVRDSGAAVGASDKAHIRIAFGEIDGSEGSTLGLGFLPGQASFSGDILIDSDETSFFTPQRNFLKVILHEIGHAIGLDHVTGIRAVMNPLLNDLVAPIADDIAGVSQLYGTPSGRDGELALGFGLDDIEIVESAHGVAIRGSDRGNFVKGGAGAERIFGEGGDDRLIGRGGADRLMGGEGEDTLLGGAGNDNLHGGGQSDRLLGGGRSDRLFGDGGRDTLLGGGGDDRLSGGGARDRLDGGRGDDRLMGGGAADRLFGRAGVDRLWGGQGEDRLFGAESRDRLNGGNDDDTLGGGGGGDILRGGRGDDLLVGGSGADRFIFEAGGGADRVADFAPGVDLLDFARVQGVGSLRDLSITREGSATRLAFGDDLSVLLSDLRPADLDADSFIF